MFKRLINNCISLFEIITSFLVMVTSFVDIKFLIIGIKKVCGKIAYFYNTFIDFMEQLENSIYAQTICSLVCIILLFTILFGVLYAIISLME